MGGSLRKNPFFERGGGGGGGGGTDIFSTRLIQFTSTESESQDTDGLNVGPLNHKTSNLKHSLKHTAPVSILKTSHRDEYYYNHN